MSDYLEVGTFLSSGKSTGDEPEREFLGIASAEPQAHLPLDVKIAGWSQWQPGEGVERLARVFAHARQILDHPLTVADLAAVAVCTPTHLNRLFTTHLGMHAHEWIEKTKMERAATLLRTRRIPICQICDLVGYEDPFHFSHTFKRVTGMSPSQYRAHCRRVIETSRRAARGRKIS